MSLRRILWILFILFVLFFIISSPVQAAHVVRVTGETLGEWLGALFTSLSKFVTRLV
jgi:hypothetical protein